MLGLQTQCQYDAGVEECDQNYLHFQENVRRKELERVELLLLSGG